LFWDAFTLRSRRGIDRASSDSRQISLMLPLVPSGGSLGIGDRGWTDSGTQTLSMGSPDANMAGTPTIARVRPGVETERPMAQTVALGSGIGPHVKDEAFGYPPPDGSPRPFPYPWDQADGRKETAFGLQGASTPGDRSMAGTEPEHSLTGGCQCGAIRYALSASPREIYVCHCGECRKQSSSAFGISVMVRTADLRVVRGNPRRWSRSTDAGRILACFFCPTCGSRVWHGDMDQADEISIKGGSLDEPPDLTDAIHIWTARRLPGVVIPERARQYAGEPDESIFR
jgi:hypothetical protein